MAGARVAVGVAPAYLPMGAAPAGTAVTDAHGRFRLLGLSPGDHDLEAYAADIGRGTVSVQVKAGRPTGGVRIRLEAAAGEGEPVATGSVAVTLGESGSDVVEVVVVHVAELVADRKDELSLDPNVANVAFADPCRLGRHLVALERPDHLITLRDPERHLLRGSLEEVGNDNTGRRVRARRVSGDSMLRRPDR